MLEVTDQDAVDQKDFGTAYVSIPVQVGPKVPLLRCPDAAVRVVAGGLPRVVDIPTLLPRLAARRHDPRRRHASRPAGRPRPTAVARRRRPGRAAPHAAAPSSAPKQLPRPARGRAPRGSTQPVTHRRRRRRAASPRTVPCRRRGCGRSASRASRRASPAPSTSPATSTRPSRSRPARSRTRASRAGSGLTVSASGCRLTLTVGARPTPTATVALDRVRRPGAHGRRPGHGDDARQPVRAAPGRRRRRPRRRRPGPRLVAAADLRRRLARSAATPCAHRRLERARRGAPPRRAPSPG